jgi:hypothetical protein
VEIQTNLRQRVSSKDWGQHNNPFKESASLCLEKKGHNGVIIVRKNEIGKLEFNETLKSSSRSGHFLKNLLPY